MFYQHKQTVVFGILGLLLAGCGAKHQPADVAASASSAALRVNAAVIVQGAQCGGPEPAVRLVTDLHDWVSLVSGGRRAAVGAAAPSVDLGGGVMLWISMGEQSTAGYSLSLVSGSVSRSGAELVVVIESVEPSPEDVVAQVITRPCLGLRLPPGEYPSVRVVDTAGREIARTDAAPGAATPLAVLPDTPVPGASY